MKRSMIAVMSVAAVMVLTGGLANAGYSFNGQADYSLDQYGCYVVMMGGKFVEGQTMHGEMNTSAHGGTQRWITDDPVTGGGAIDVWHQDSFFDDTAGIALTLKNGNTTVYDNNGIEDGSYPTGYYTLPGHGAYVAWSMANNYDWLYATYFKLAESKTFNTMVGYFPEHGMPAWASDYEFNPDSSAVSYRMNIWSREEGSGGIYWPKNTGSFAGDVFTTDTVEGSFSWSDTGVDVIGSSGIPRNIFRLVFTLNEPMTLAAGEYFFSHDVVVPEPGTLVLLGMGGLGVLAYAWRRRRAAM